MSRPLETFNGHMFVAVAVHSDPNVPSCITNRYLLWQVRKEPYINSYLWRNWGWLCHFINLSWHLLFYPKPMLKINTPDKDGYFRSKRTRSFALPRARNGGARQFHYLVVNGNIQPICNNVFQKDVPRIMHAFMPVTGAPSLSYGAPTAVNPDWRAACHEFGQSAKRLPSKLIACLWFTLKLFIMWLSIRARDP